MTKPAMHTASVFQGHLFGTKGGHFITAMYRGKYVHTVSCNESEKAAKLELMKTYLKAVNFTHYRDEGVGLAKPL